MLAALDEADLCGMQPEVGQPGPGPEKDLDWDRDRDQTESGPHFRDLETRKDLARIGVRN